MSQKSFCDINTNYTTFAVRKQIFMKAKIYTLLFSLLLPLTATALETTNDSTKTKEKHPMFISLKGEYGTAIKTNDYLKETGKLGYSSLSLRYGFSPKEHSWANNAYRLPYAGVGLSMHHTEDDAFGHPFTLYLFQGSEVTSIFKWMSLFYEVQLGYSANWGHYDRFRQPKNITIGSGENVYVGGNMYLKFLLSKHWDLNLGAGFCHFSNGANMMPNKGMNIVTPFMEVAYKFNETQKRPDTAFVKPERTNKIDHQIIATLSSRQKYYSVIGTGLSTQYVNHKHRVYGLSYARLFVPSYKYKWGPSLDFLYDESSQAYATRDFNPTDGKEYDNVHLGDPIKRFSMGLSLKGEVKMSFLTYFANLGYDIIHYNDYDARLYEIIGVKCDLTPNLFCMFGIRATRFSRAQFFCWSLGYTLKQ